MEIEVKLPDIGLEKVEVVEILIKKHDVLTIGQEIIIVEGQKASMGIPSEHCGTVTNVIVKVGDILEKNSLILMLNEKNYNDVSNKKNHFSRNSLQKKSNNFLLAKETLNYNNINTKNLIYASPLVRRLSRILNIDLKKVKSSGIKNRVSKNDITNYLAESKKNQVNCIQSNNINLQLHKLTSNLEKFGKIEEKKINNVQKTLSENLSWNWKNIPHVTQFDKADITSIERFRDKINNQKIKNSSIFQTKKITLLVFLIKIVFYALKKFPIFNSSLSPDKNSIILKKYYNIGIAVNTSKGLVVPVIKDVDKKNIYEISEELVSLSEKSRLGKINVSDMQGGCFTISNLGKIGGTNFTPIINFPEVAILGLSKTVMEMIWKKNKFVPRLMLPMSMSYDHRVINGVDASYFLSFINDCLSDIRLLII